MGSEKYHQTKCNERKNKRNNGKWFSVCGLVVLTKWIEIKEKTQNKIVTIIYELLLSIGLCDTGCVQVWIKSKKEEKINNKLKNEMK